MAIDTDNNQDSLLPFPEGQEEATPRRRSDRTGKQAAKATRRPGRPPRSVAPLTTPDPPAPEKKEPARRGRPPKNAAPAIAEAPRRKPGRPPKVRISEVPPPPPLVPVPPPPPSFEEPVAEVVEIVELELAPPPPAPVATPAPVAPAPTPPRRGPGRPRKVQTVETPPPPLTVPAKPAMPTLGILAEPGNRLGEMGVHAVGFFRALFNLGATSEQGKPPEIEVLTTKDVARIVQAKEAEVVQAILNGQLRATPIGKSWRTTPGNVKIWLEG